MSTLGPASCNPEILGGMIDAGMDVGKFVTVFLFLIPLVRLNFSHGEHSFHREAFNMIRNVAHQVLEIVIHS